MRIDVRENIIPFDSDPFLWTLFDKETGKKISGEEDDEYVVAVDDSTGQIVKYNKNEQGQIALPIISEIRNVELVYEDRK